MPMDMNTGVPLPMGDEPMAGGGYRPEEKGRRFLLVGGPFGPMFPLGMMPVDYDEEEEDPNP